MFLTFLKSYPHIYPQFYTQATEITHECIKIYKGLKGHYKLFDKLLDQIQMKKSLLERFLSLNNLRGATT